ncbi:uncharacterized protein VTP21DRAFT_621 [Calcarisporiella thermophila]|uniref:uncharacterized protein n=1 Tax=Calcarisporiella thermophila TaxID=911321 RepID=UPI00374405D6
MNPPPSSSAPPLSSSAPPLSNTPEQILQKAQQECRYVDPEGIDPDLICSICHDVFVDVAQARRCRHHFCRSCILSAIARSKTCALCRAPLNEMELKRSVRIERIVNQLEVRCFWESCAWVGRRDELVHHLKTECQEMLVYCNVHEEYPDCKAILPRKLIDEHRKSCAFKMISCSLGCSKKFYKEEELKEHVSNDCINREVPCKMCHAVFRLCDQYEHDEVCPKRVIPCPHRNILGHMGGCTEMVEREKIGHHLSHCKYEPLKEAFTAIRLQTLALEKRIDQLQQETIKDLDQLTTLRLHAADVSTADQLKSILKYNPAIRSLHALDFQPGPSWQLFAETLMENDTLVKVNLKGSEIENLGAVLLAKAIRVNHRLRSLDLTDNCVSDQGLEHIAKALDVNQTLTFIDLSGNEIGDKGIEVFARTLEHPNVALEHIDLSWNNTRNRGAEALGRALSLNRRIRFLDLRANEIGSKGCEQLAHSLRINSVLCTLHLGYNKIGSKGCEYLARALEANTTLRTLVLAENYIENAGAEFLAVGLMKNHSLSTLDLDRNQIGPDGAESLVRAMNSSLAGVRFLTLRGNPVMGEAALRLARLAKNVRVRLDLC